MADDSDTQLIISGHIDSQAAFDAMVEAIVAEQPGVDWEASIDNREDAIAFMIESQDIGLMIFSENERSGENFPKIEAACRDHGLGYVLKVSPNEAHETPGSREVWAPGFDEPLELPGSEDGAGALVSATHVKTLVDSGQIPELERYLALAINPESVIPPRFSLNPEFTPAPAMAI